MRIKTMLLILVLLTSLLAGCAKAGNIPKTQVQATNTPNNTANNTTEAVSSASIVDNADAFVEAISRGGTWIIITKNDLKIDKDLLVDGEFKNTKQPPVSQRKIALYAQDENRKVTARYTLTAPKMTINSPDCGLWYGTFKGDIYVAAKNFQLKGATVDGNIYFTTDEAKATFKPDADSKITGKQELKK